MMRMNIDDGDIFLGEFENGALCSVQTSFVTVGNYPGIEARVYGSKGALICRLVEEAGICETLRAATPDQVEFRELEVPARCYPPGGSRQESWRTLFYANLDQQLHRRDPERRRGERGRFRRRRLGAGSHQRRGTVVPRAPMGVAAVGAVMLDAFFESYYRLRPVNATFTGVHEHDHRLPDWSPEGLARRSTRCARCARRWMRRPNHPRACSDVVERDRQLATAFLDVQIAEHRERPFSACESVARGGRGHLRHDRADDAAVRAGCRARRGHRALTAVRRRSSKARVRSIATAGSPTNGALKACASASGAERLLRDGIRRWIALECHRRRERESSDRRGRAGRCGVRKFK